MTRTKPSKCARKKQYHTKSDTGCLACRSRRVRCDEMKPNCVRCVRSERECVYQRRSTKIFTSSTEKLAILSPKERAITRIHVPIPVNYGPTNSVRSLDFFLKRTAPMCSMGSPIKELWTIIVPQASWQYAAVQDMLVAVSMLDQYLAGSLPHLLVTAEYRSALQHYNKGIRTLLSMVNPTVSCLLLVSVLAWAFENITNRPTVAAMHAHAASNIIIETQGGFSALSVEDQFIVNCFEETLSNRGYVHDHGYRRSDRQLQQFQSVYDARQVLFAIVENLLRLKPVSVGNIVYARQAIINWRAAFEAYRYIGWESLKQKRAVYMAHNIIGTYIVLLDPEFLAKERDAQQYLLHHILNDVEHVVEYEDLAETSWILSILLRHIDEEAKADEHLRVRAERLINRLVI